MRRTGIAGPPEGLGVTHSSTPPHRWALQGDASEGEGPQRRPQRRLGRRLEEVAEAVGGGYCRLQMPSRLALGVRGTVAGRRLGPLEGGVDPPPPSNASGTLQGGRGDKGGGISAWEIVVFREGGEMFPWRDLGALAVQCAREAVQASGFAGAAKLSPSEIVPGDITPVRSYPPV